MRRWWIIGTTRSLGRVGPITWPPPLSWARPGGHRSLSSIRPPPAGRWNRKNKAQNNLSEAIKKLHSWEIDQFIRRLKIFWGYFSTTTSYLYNKTLSLERRLVSVHYCSFSFDIGISRTQSFCILLKSGYKKRYIYIYIYSWQGKRWCLKSLTMWPNHMYGLLLSFPTTFVYSDCFINFQVIIMSRTMIFT